MRRLSKFCSLFPYIYSGNRERSNFIQYFRAIFATLDLSDNVVFNGRIQYLDKALSSTGQRLLYLLFPQRYLRIFQQGSYLIKQVIGPYLLIRSNDVHPAVIEIKYGVRYLHTVASPGPEHPLAAAFFRDMIVSTPPVIA